MASPHLRLLELLQLEEVRGETYAVFTTLLRRCANDRTLSAFVLHNVDERLQEQGHIYTLATLHGLAGCVSCPPKDHCARMRSQLLSSVADALNHEACRWMSDFLLIAIGKRAHRHRMYPSLPLLQDARHDDIHTECNLDELWDMAVLRDGPRCCVSGAIHSVVCVQLIPISDDIERSARFRVLARVFFQEEIPTLSDEHLRSPENAAMLSMHWMDRLDKGQLIFKYVGEEFHAIPLHRDDADDLAEERRNNGVVGPSLLEFYGGLFPRNYPRLHPQLAWLHRVLIETWQETGQSCQGE